jgi:predicted TIM-barrel fold metal-dependent hydrolase
MIVDAHAHVFARVSDRFPRDVSELSPPDLEVPVEELITAMEANGVSHAVLVAVSPHDEYLRDCLMRYPGRFAAVGIQPSDSFSVAEYLRRRDANVLQGLRLFALGDPDIEDVDQLASFPLLRQMAEEGSKLWFYSSEEQMRLLDRVLERLPTLVVVLNHLGFCPGEMQIDQYGRPHFGGELPPPTLTTTLRLAEHPSVYVLFSGHYAFSSESFPFEDLRTVVERLLEAFGPQRLLLGSDFPWIRDEPGYSAVLSLVDFQLPQLSPEDRAQVLGGNALRLFNFGPA